MYVHVPRCVFMHGYTMAGAYLIYSLSSVRACVQYVSVCLGLNLRAVGYQLFVNLARPRG